MKAMQDAIKKYFNECKQGNTNLITSQELYNLLSQKKEPVFLLDIRKKEDFNKNHINGSLNIFWHEVGDFMDVLPKNEKIIVICYTGQSSGQVVSLFKIAGLDAYSLKGGMNNGWLKDSLPTKAGCGT